MSNAEKIQAVINTLEMMMIPASFDNVNRMMGIYQTLIEMRDSMDAQGRMKPAEEGEADV